MDIPSKYEPSAIEKKRYDYWMKNGFFHSEPDPEREAYTIVIPPPNVTGVLHMGHMLNNTLQDVLIRRARLLGYNACWVPGTDHASIATEAKVVAKLAEEGISKDDITREEFLEHAWEWTHKHGGVILKQLKKLGASCDWERTKFTLDEDMSESVKKVFIDLYNKGYIYRGYRMVNWDPQAQTTLSDEEVEYVEKQGKLYYIQYPVEGTEEYVTIATTRPETLLGDTAVCVHPEDERFVNLHGKNVIVPICDRVVPVITDTYVDREFGTGCLKITPAHDPNDKIIGEKHHLDVIDIFNDDGTLNANGLHYENQDRFAVRKAIVKELEEKGYLLKIEDYTHKVGVSERTKAVIEPKISAQWFLKMENIVPPAYRAVNEGEIRFFPKHYINTYNHWLENIRDWNISRQLWWGHRIPAYFYGDGVEDFVVAADEKEALEAARKKTGNPGLTATDIRQDPDVLDTWFSSWLWPISVFNGINEPDNPDFNYYYPTKDLVTGPDIIFFWVARMIFAGYELKNEKPFENVYFTGIVRDKLGRKMSKSLGNSPDPLKLIEEYGADGVRVGLLLSSAAGNDLLFEEELCRQGRNFANKIWNGVRLVKSWKVDPNAQADPVALKAIQWYKAKFQESLESIEKSFEQYRISEALMSIYKLLWDEFSSWFLEMVKPAYGEPIDETTYQSTLELLEDNMRLLHPFMPFITEEIWHYLKERDEQDALIVNRYPVKTDYDKTKVEDFEWAKEVVSGIRNIRKQNQIPFKEAVELYVVNKENRSTAFDDAVQKLTHTSAIHYVDTEPENSLSFRVKANIYNIPSGDKVDVEEEIAKIREDIEYTEGFLRSVRKKLDNERFVQNAPEQVVANERKKEQDAIRKIEVLKESLERLLK